MVERRLIHYWEAVRFSYLMKRYFASDRPHQERHASTALCVLKIEPCLNLHFGAVGIYLLATCNVKANKHLATFSLSSHHGHGN